MATRFLDKEHGATTSTAIANDTAGRIKIMNYPDAVGIVYDRADDSIKYNAEGTIKWLVSADRVQNVGTVVTPTAATALTAAQSGSTVFLNAAAGFAITLPAPAAGVSFTFITAAAFATTNFTVVTSGSSNIIFGGADVNSTWVPADAEDSINFVATAETVGDWITVVSDGTNWFVRGQVTAAGGVTFTAA